MLCHLFSYAELFGCGIGLFPINFLGISIHYWRLTLAEWKHTKERLKIKVHRFGKAIYYLLVDDWVLINSVLSNMVLYMIYFFQLPKEVLHRQDYFLI
jgi:hypothetical protein